MDCKASTHLLPCQLFRQGELDAWVVWMPYAPTPARSTYPGRSIADLYSILGDRAAAELPTLYYAIPELVRDYPRLLKALLEELNEAEVLVNCQQFEQALDQNRADAFDPDVLETLYQHTLERSILPIDEPTLRSLRHQADVLPELGLIAARVAVSDGTYSLQTRQNWIY